MTITNTLRRDVMLRAWQIRKVNPTQFTFSAALKLAWSEIKEFGGQKPYFWHLSEVEQVKAEIITLENRNRLTPAINQKLSALYSRRTALSNAA